MLTRKIRVLSVFGTRPEAIKMAPVVLALREHPAFDAQVCVTGQHREMLDQVLGLFGVEPEFDLDLMRADQDLTDITTSVLQGLRPVFNAFRPDRILVHGDTTTTISAALAGFYARTPVAHVEAGLRTGTVGAPWPEEMNRRATAAIADLHFAPTETARRNLLDEGVPAESIVVTGNTVIDALQHATSLLKQSAALQAGVDALVKRQGSRPLLLVTGHRRESFGPKIESICQAVRRIASRQNVFVVFPVHPNPNIHDTAISILRDTENVALLKPLEYPAFIALLDKASLVLTDSGGVQEEASALGKPVLVTRDATDRPETVELGTAVVTGTGVDRIVSETEHALGRIARGEAVGIQSNAFGDGKASGRIVRTLLDRHGRTPEIERASA